MEYFARNFAKNLIYLAKKEKASFRFNPSISITTNRVIIEWLYEVDPDRAWDILVTQAQGLSLL
jgi:hypothetical protein